MVHGGMLASVETIRVVAKALEERKVERLVVDPVRGNSQESLRQLDSDTQCLHLGHGSNHRSRTSTF